MKIAKTLTAIAAVAVATAAFAAVTLNANGTGFVGKGDVQLVTGWNNQQLQAHAPTVKFAAEVTDTYAAVCSWITGEGTRGEKPHNVTHSRTVAVNSAVDSTLRRNAQSDVNGFILTGYGTSVTTGGSVPVAGGACNGNDGHGGTWSSVSQPISTGALYVVGYATPIHNFSL